ncbi:hypothetical protein MKW92_034691 [Papaver armeniacum]|nr:hypothetical protein MKW92_034691 [Papaver armeniacum]
MQRHQLVLEEGVQQMVVLQEEVQRVVDLVVLLELYSIYVALTAMALGSHKALEWASQLGCLEVFLEGSPRDVIAKHFTTHKELLCAMIPGQKEIFCKSNLIHFIFLIRFFGSSPMKWKSLVKFTNDHSPS